MAMQTKANEDDMRKFVNALSGVFSNIEPAMHEIGQILVDSISENFDKGGRHGGGKYGGSDGAVGTWIPSKRALEQNGMTLQDTGRLAASFTYEISGNAIVVGTNVVYAAIHNFGGFNGPGKSVHQIARPFAVIQSEDEADIADVLVALYARRLAAAFG